MKQSILILLSLTIILGSIKSQGLTEDQIPFPLNTDGDGDINVVDNDDDNDLTLDNDDVFPLDGSQTSNATGMQTVFATDDAGLRNNNSNGANNYDTNAEMKGPLRSFIMKLGSSAQTPLISATLTFYSNDEDDPLEVYFLPYTGWDESTITYNTMDFTDEILLGLTSAPTGVEGDYTYTYDLPIGLIPSSGEFTIRVIEPNNDAKEYLFTKEDTGVTAAKIDYVYSIIPEDRIQISAQSNVEYIDGGTFNYDVQLVQAPTSSVYIPFEVTDASVGDFDFDEVLVFDATNWNTPQTISVNAVGLGDFDMLVRPLHSDDAFYNGHNPDDLSDFLVQASDIPALSDWTVATGDTLIENLVSVSGVGAGGFLFKVLQGPSGLNVIENTGEIRFRPLSNQIGVHDVILSVTDDQGNVSNFVTTVTVTDGGAADPVGYILDFLAADDPMADGSVDNPFNDLNIALDYVAADGGGDILIRGIEYNLSAKILITTAATEEEPITVKPMDGEKVKFNFDLFAAFEFDELSRHITFEGFEIDGNTDQVDFWCIVGLALWGDTEIPRGGGQAIILDGQWITIRNNYIHDAYQKAVEIEDGRYVKVYGNVIEKIATSSLSGGHGIMRQQKGMEFLDDDSVGVYRWDIKGNILFNVEQRIYSWVPSKGFMEMTLDEGKPILIDDPQDSDGVQEQMSARIKDNVVAFGSIDAIRLKSTPNLEVSNNSIFSNSTHADGITDKGGDTPTPQFLNFIGKNNAVQTGAGTTAIELDDCINQTVNNGGVPDISGNIAVIGTVKPTGYSGIDTNPTSQLFVDADNGDFMINPALGLPATLGIDPDVLDSLMDRGESFGVDIKWDGWTNNDMKLTQSILDNLPGINDGIAGNDTVFTSIGIMNAERNHIDFDVVIGGTWQVDKGAPDTMQFRLNEEYTEWYHEVEMDHPGYERLRWGCSYPKQNQVFQDNWLVHSQITSDTNTVIYAPDYDFVMDGDLLVEFVGVTPADGDFYDLMVAGDITSVNSMDVFDAVFFEGYTPSEYSIEIVDVPEGKAVRLTIGGCSKVVTSISDSGEGSLRAALACATDGDTITLDAVLENDTIKLTSSQLIIDKSVFIESERQAIFVQNCSSSSDIVIASGKSVILKNFQILSDVITNNGTLTCSDIVFKKKDGTDTAEVINSPMSTLIIKDEVRIE